MKIYKVEVIAITGSLHPAGTKVNQELAAFCEGNCFVFHCVKTMELCCILKLDTYVPIDKVTLFCNLFVFKDVEDVSFVV